MRLLDQIDVVVEGRLGTGGDAVRLQRVAAANGLTFVVVGAPSRRRGVGAAAPVIPVVPAAEGPGEIRRLQIAGRVVATIGGRRSSRWARDLPIGVSGRDGRAPDGSHVSCRSGIPDALRVLNACLPASPGQPGECPPVARRRAGRDPGGHGAGGRHPDAARAHGRRHGRAGWP